MKHVKLEEDNKLVNFNVVSLLASVSVELAIRIATDVLFEDDTLKDRIAIHDEDIVDLLDFCLSTTNFKHNNPFYQLCFCYGLSCGTCQVQAGNGKPGATPFVHLSHPALVLEMIC